MGGLAPGNIAKTGLTHRLLAGGEIEGLGQAILPSAAQTMAIINVPVVTRVSAYST